VGKVNWLHLSDIHFHNDSAETIWLRQKLLSKLKEDNQTYELLFITGDLLYQFQNGFDKDLINFLNKILEVTGIKRENTFIVPGNHDFKRSVVRKYYIEPLKLDTNEIHNRVTAMPEEIFQHLIDGQAEFWEFHKNFLGREDDFRKLHFINERQNVNIINLNTCLISGVDKEEGTLSLDFKRLLKVLSDLEDTTKPNIAIGHHSIECLNDVEREEIIQLFEDYNVDIYLCGHIHKSKYKIYKEGNREIRSLVCGSNMKDNYADASYIKGEIDLENYKCTVTYYNWASKRKEWILDNDVSRIIDDGKLAFPLERLIISTNIEQIKVKDTIDQFLTVNIDEDKFVKFLLDFSKEIKNYSDDSKNYKIEVEKKFTDMKCCKTIQREFDSHAEYFGLIDNIFDDPSYLPYDKKIVIPGVIQDNYTKVFDECKTGTEIMTMMVQNLCGEYSGILSVSRNELKEYFKTMIYWSINKCDIYDDIK
jgi:UDP-2,3-diacylglucosamine pyrophosphatase LpxH